MAPDQLPKSKSLGHWQGSKPALRYTGGQHRLVLAHVIGLENYPIVQERVLVVGGTQEAAEYLRAKSGAGTIRTVLPVHQSEKVLWPTLSLAMNSNPSRCQFVENARAFSPSREESCHPGRGIWPFARF